MAIAVVLFVVLRTFVLQTFVITSGSMENTLLVNDYLLVNRLAYGARIPFTRKHLPGYSEPRRGDVVVFDPHHDPELKLVKRLIGMPGDTLWMRGGTLYINGEEQVEPYVLHREPETDAWSDWFVWQRDALVDTVDASTYRPTRDNWGPLVVPEGHYFMLGDNRDQSLDSRYWGPLATWRVEGRASLIYYSWDDRSVRPLPALTAIRTERIFRRIR
ncbi:MAG: signal peptidase I [Gemmatimonadetes bacterium]|nr:MAG: signal peptidase I [Gemmatimonadota bacterium]